MNSIWVGTGVTYRYMVNYTSTSFDTYLIGNLYFIVL